MTILVAVPDLAHLQLASSLSDLSRKLHLESIVDSVE
jgi:hypothetical protein